MKNYYRVMLGRKSVHAALCYQGNFIGTGFLKEIDLTGKLPDDWRSFNKEYIPIWQEKNPGKSKIAAGLACGALWVVSKGIQKGDVVLCPDGEGRYYIGEVIEGYSYHAGEIFPHRRSVHWHPKTVERSAMSEGLRNSTGSIGTVSTITKYADEIEGFITGSAAPTVVSTDANVEDPAAFVMEKHLEDFLVQNWAQTDLGKEYDIYEEDGESVGQQYATDTGPLDVLAISKDKKTLLVVELKKGRASDAVVGQVLRYMGYVQEELAEPGQTVRGVIIALDDDQRIRRALAMVPNIEFYRYQISFKLVKG